MGRVVVTSWTNWCKSHLSSVGKMTIFKPSGLLNP